MMRGKILPLKVLMIALPIFITFMVAAAPAKACEGGPPGVEYVHDDMVAADGEYTSLAIKAKDNYPVDVSFGGVGTLLVLNGDQMTDFEAGREHRSIVDINGSDRILNNVTLKKGMTYYVVLDNTEGSEPVTSKVDIGRVALKCGSDPEMGILPAPGFGAGYMLIAFVTLGAIMTIRKRC